MKRLERLATTALLTIVVGIGLLVCGCAAVTHGSVTSAVGSEAGLPLGIGMTVGLAVAVFVVVHVTRLDRTIPGPLPVNDVMAMPEPHEH